MKSIAWQVSEDLEEGCLDEGGSQQQEQQEILKLGILN